jgi:hypothetical protein
VSAAPGGSRRLIRSAPLGPHSGYSLDRGIRDRNAAWML